jgi:hypothetical protein
MVLAMAGGLDLLKRTQQVFFQKNPSKVSKVRGEMGIWREGGEADCLIPLSILPPQHSIVVLCS